MGRGETGFEDAHGEGMPNPHKCTLVDLLEKKRAVGGNAIVQNLLTSLHRVYAPLNRKQKSKVRIELAYKSLHN